MPVQLLALEAAGLIDKELCIFISDGFGLWERFLTAISHAIVAGGHSHHPLTST
jgi:hypothetical protein